MLQFSNMENPAYEAAKIGSQTDEGKKRDDGVPADLQSQKTTWVDGEFTHNGTAAVAETNVEITEVNVKPFFFCRWITNHPKASFALTLCLHLLMLLITIILLRAGYDILPITFDRLPLDIKNDPDFLHGRAWVNRDQDPTIIRRNKGSDNQTERSQVADYVSMYFEIPGGNVFTQENLQLINNTENDFLFETEFWTKYCFIGASSDCSKPTSIIRFFDGTYKMINPIFDDPNFDNIVNVTYAAYTHNLTKALFQSLLGKSAIIDGQEAVSEITVSTLFVGWPLQGYVNTSDRQTAQEDEIKKFMQKTFRPMAERRFSNGVGQMDFFYNSVLLLSVSISRQAMLDMMLAVGSMVTIGVFMCIQTGSLWVAGWATMSVFTSFTCANLIYRIILDYRYFGVFHVLAVFIILGIGADDVFVFFDTWKATSHKKYISLAHRMSACYRKAAAAMFFTSITTAVAFAVSAASPFLGISSFGVFSGLLVIVNYLSVIIFFPTVVLTHHLWWEKKTCCCCTCSPSCCTCSPGQPSVHTESTQTSSGSEVGKRKHPIVRFFRGPYYQFITNKVAACCIVGLFVVFFAVVIYFATTIQVNEEQIKFLKDSSNFGKALDRRNTAFKTVTETRRVQVYLVWGLKQQDKSQCHHTDVNCQGRTVYDERLNMNDNVTQNALRDFCTRLKNLPTETIKKLSIRRNIVTNIPEVDCFVHDMETFLQNSQNGSLPFHPNASTLDYPIDEQDAMLIMTQIPIYNTSELHPHFSSYFEVAASFWLYNGFRLPSTQFHKFARIIGEAKNPPYTIETTIGTGGQTYTYYYGTKLRYFAFIVNTTLNGATLGYPTGLPIRDEWQKFMEDEVAQMPETLKGGFQCTPGGFNTWHWLKVQKNLVTSATNGIIIGISLAFPILVVATHNIIVGFLATLTIAFITTCVLAVIPMAGWKLGVLESLNLVLVVGLAVDYVVHLAEGYARSPHRDRLGRVKDTLEEVGISVLSGAATTLMASLFLLFAEILFFVQFGIFMFSTIGLSLLCALGFFVTVLGLIGPQNDFGSLKVLYRMCQGKSQSQSQSQSQSM